MKSGTPPVVRYHGDHETQRGEGMGVFKQLEAFASGDSLPLGDVLAELPWNADGLLPAIAQQHDSGEVLMMAWMNRKAIEESLRTRRVCYWSRSCIL